MRRLLFLLLLLCAPSAYPAGKTWDFKVYLDGREVGTHRFTLAGTGGQRELRSEASFDYKLLFLGVWRYRHEALERWEGRCLASLVSRTEDNGERYAVDWRRGERCEMSFAYWDPRILAASRLLNAQTGELEPVEVTALGGERWRLSTSGMHIELSYADGDWTGLEAMRDGRRLRYVRERGR
jgi:hypothetical protein